MGPVAVNMEVQLQLKGKRKKTMQSTPFDHLPPGPARDGGVTSYRNGLWPLVSKEVMADLIRLGFLELIPGVSCVDFSQYQMAIDWDQSTVSIQWIFDDNSASDITNCTGCTDLFMYSL